MNSFDLKQFSSRLIAESLFYDAEFGAIGNVSLVSEEEKKEMYIAYFLTEESKFVIDKVTKWEEVEQEELEAIGYALAVDTDDHMSSESQDDIAREMMALAEKFNLMPSVSLFFEEESE